MIVLAPARGLAEEVPVRRPVARTLEPLRIHEALQVVDWVAVEILPVPGETPGHAAEKMAGKVRDPHPWQDEETGVVGEEADVLLARLPGPSDEAVPGAEVTRRRRPSEACHRASLGENQVLQVLAHRPGVAQVVVLLEQTVQDRFRSRSPDGAELEWP